VEGVANRTRSARAAIRGRRDSLASNISAICCNKQLYTVTRRLREVEFNRRWDAETNEVVRENWESAFEKPLDVYQQLIPGDTDEASSKKRHRKDDLGMLLERLRLSAGVELRRL
jgi:hypothetical protein